MSLGNMNSLKFLPRKDYIANRLTTGILQLSDRTHLVVDETALQPGQLDTKGTFIGPEMGKNMDNDAQMMHKLLRRLDIYYLQQDGDVTYDLSH